ncbi:12755_t:CDS:10 [Acaulospora colombiana]|uniref:12755_t:CDS:1 n=1 Tax=Acaulospora colombiana TaxID=27376 RepID=A0ACA9JXD1_9GLOM|nr:12755_t:CDS:10 [Acaulospora colombiana]
MIVYLVTTLPWMIGTLKIGLDDKNAVRWRKSIFCLFFGTLVPMIYYFIQHKVHHVAGAYTIYAFFEWSLIFYDVAFDAISFHDLSFIELRVISAGRGSSDFLLYSIEISSSDKDSISGFPGAKNSTVNASTITPYHQYLKDLFLSSDIGYWNNIMEYATDTYLAFVYWSMLTSLALTIWYFPLWYMGISGYEAFLLVTSSPVLLGINSVRRTVRSYPGLFHLFSLVGLASYMFVDPVTRLILVSVGVAIANLTWTSAWTENRNNMVRLERNALIWGVGLIASNVVKMAWWTNNPIWPIMHGANGGRNGVGLALGILASLLVMLRDGKGKSKSTEQRRKVSGSWASAAAGLGSLMFALHSLLSDTTTLTRWVYEGYPNTGPLPVPWGGILTIMAMSLGLVLSSYRKIVVGIHWYVIGCVSCTCLYYYSTWKGYYGGLLLGVYIMSLIPSFIRGVSQHPPGRTLFTAMMIYNVLCLAHVWIVAYAFVPAGEYMREHTDYVLFAMMILIGLGVREASVNSSKFAQMNNSHHNRSLTRGGLGIMILVTIIVAFSRASSGPPVPYHPEQKLITAGIWTIHFGLDNDMWASEVRMRDLIRDMELDVVGLLESDTGRIIMGNRDLTQFLAEDLNMYADYGPGPSKHTWGCAMLSKFPIIKSTHHLLPSPKGELACAIHATLDVYGKEVDFIVSHNGQEEDVEDRKLQTTELARIMRESQNPFVFLGYVVTKPFEGNYFILMDDGNVNDIDKTDYDRWCEYIAYRGIKKVGYARVSHGRITDTELQVGKFQVLDGYDRSNWKAVDNRIQENEVIPELRFTPIFRGEGKSKLLNTFIIMRLNNLAQLQMFHSLLDKHVIAQHPTLQKILQIEEAMYRCPGFDKAWKLIGGLSLPFLRGKLDRGRKGQKDWNSKKDRNKDGSEPRLNSTAGFDYGFDVDFSAIYNDAVKATPDDTDWLTSNLSNSNETSVSDGVTSIKIKLTHFGVNIACENRKDEWEQRIPAVLKTRKQTTGGDYEFTVNFEEPHAEVTATNE